MAATRKANTLIGPLRNRTYNPTALSCAALDLDARARSRPRCSAAMHDGTLRHSDYEGVPVTVARRAGRVRALPRRCSPTRLCARR